MGGVWEKLPSIRSITTIPNQFLHYQQLQHILLHVQICSYFFRPRGELRRRFIHPNFTVGWYPSEEKMIRFTTTCAISAYHR